MPTNAEIADRLAEDWSDAGLAECLDDLKDRITAALTTAQAQAYEDAAKIVDSKSNQECKSCEELEDQYCEKCSEFVNLASMLWRKRKRLLRKRGRR